MATKNPAKPKKQQYQNLYELLLLKLKVLHDVENQLIKALPQMANAATSPELKSAFEMHLEQTRGHEARIDQALEKMGDTGKHKESSAAIRGLIQDAEWCIKNIKEPATLDAALAASAQYVEHYEIAGYGSAHEWAEEMGHGEVAELLLKTLKEEEKADEKLTQLAENGINQAANNMPRGVELLSGHAESESVE